MPLLPSRGPVHFVRLGGLVVGFVAALSPGASAASVAEKEMAAEMEDCRSADPQTATRGCSALLARGILPDHVLWLALEHRGVAHLASAAQAGSEGRDEDASRAFEDARVDAERLVRIGGRPERRAVARDLEGRALFGLRRWPEAAAAFSEVLAADPSALDARANRARALANQGEDDRALADFDAGVAGGRGQAAPLLDRGRFHFERGRIRAALDDFERAVTFAPNSAVALYWRGRTKFRLEDLDGAGADLDAAIYRDQKYGAALVERGLVHERGGRTEPALALYRRAALGPPHDRSAEAARRRISVLAPAPTPVPTVERRRPSLADPLFDAPLARRN